MDKLLNFSNFTKLHTKVSNYLLVNHKKGNLIILLYFSNKTIFLVLR